MTQLSIASGGRAINGAVSLREAGRRLGLNPHYIKGMADALGIPLEDVPPSLVMSGQDFERLKRHREVIQRERQLAAAAS